jgi:hypothetical protein
MLEMDIIVLDDGTDSTPEPIREFYDIGCPLGGP